MSGTTIRVTGPERVVRCLFERARAEHERGRLFAGLFAETTRLSDGGRYALELHRPRFGYVPLREAQEALEPVLREVADEVWRGGLAGIEVQALGAAAWWSPGVGLRA